MARENMSRRGAYVLAEAEGGARRYHSRDGIRGRCRRQARKQLEAGHPDSGCVDAVVGALRGPGRGYRKEVLGRGTVRVAVEAAVRLGWDRYIGEDGGFVGMSGFGASGAETDLYEHFGITPGKVVEEARKRLGHVALSRAASAPCADIQVTSPPIGRARIG